MVFSVECSEVNVVKRVEQMILACIHRAEFVAQGDYQVYLVCSVKQKTLLGFSTSHSLN